MANTVHIDIDEAGNVKVSVKGSFKGFEGTGCKALTEGIEKALGETVSDVKTKDFYVLPKQTQQVKR